MKGTLTWRCDVCKAERPDAKISVKKKDVSWLYGLTSYRNVKYCNDRPECAKKARKLVQEAQ